LVYHRILLCFYHSNWFLCEKFAKTGEDFFLAGRRNSSLIAGLAFLSANLGSLEILGWTGATLKYGILVCHWYWIGAIPAMLFWLFL